MQVDIFTLCDSSQVYEGKMVVMGALSSFMTPQLPIIVPSLSLAIRITYTNGEYGKKDFTISMIKPDGSLLTNDLNCSADVNPKHLDSKLSNINFNISMNNIVFDQIGTYKIELKSEGKKYSYEFVVAQIEGANK